MDDPLLGVTVGSWKLTYLLGAGGMGRVYAAVQPEIGAKVAIKVIKADSPPDVVERFFNEARAVNLIRNEHIVDVIDLGKLPDGSPYIVMEHLDGASLGALLRKGRIALGTLASIVDQVLEALEAAHAKGVIHRDLKPDNVFVSPSGHATVLDFGVAKLVGDRALAATQTGNLLGTPAYMSPEQARTQPLDARSDLYAVGVILYEGATGRLPFTASNLFDLLDLHVRATPEPPRAIDPAIPAALEAVILRALAKNPADRFASAAEMRAALAAVAEGLPRASKLSMPPPAGENADLANAETMDSADPKLAPTQATQGPASPAPAPAATSPTISRRTLIAIFAGSGAVAAAGITLIVLYVARTDQRSPPVDATAVVLAPPLPVDAGAIAVDATAPVVVAVPPADAAVRAHVTPDARPASPDASATAPDAHARRPSAAVREGELDGTPLPIGGLSHFDPIARYRDVATQAAKLAGAKIALHWLDFMDLEPGGTLGPHGVARYIFISPERVRAGGDCILEIDVKETGAVWSNGNVSSGDPDKPAPCTGAIAPPACTFAQLRTKAVAQGLPADSTDDLTLNRMGFRSWAISAGDSDWGVEDDCP